eukprot:1280197-Ditylum_brightwellii.AAC.1
MALSHPKKKDLNKFEALSILSDSNNGNNSNSDSRVGKTSNEDMNSECEWRHGQAREKEKGKRPRVEPDDVGKIK